MTDSKSNGSGSSRRDFLKQGTGTIAAASALAGVAIPSVHAGEDNTIKIALVGCGGRGTGAAANALQVQSAPIKLVAMADVFEDKLAGSYKNLIDEFSPQVDVPDDRKFIGFDAYQKAMDCLDPGDIVLLTTPPAFRWVHFDHAIGKGLHTFMEKPITVDGPTSRKMFELAKKADERGVKAAVGLMCRHCDARKALLERINDGEIGEILALRAYRMTGPVGSAFSGPKPDDISELMYQVKRFHSFLWASGGCYSDFLIHNIDECCWMKGAWPVEAKGTGARTYRGDDIDQNFDTYSVEYTFEDGTKLFLEGRNIVGCHNEFASYAHGSKNSAVISTSAHSPAKCRIYKGQRIGDRDALLWEFPQPEPNPYQLEWDHFVAAILADEYYNEVERGVKASLVTSMGRMAAHTGQVVTYDKILNSTHEFAPTVAELCLDGEAPLLADADGKYPLPMPGRKRNREY